MWVDQKQNSERGGRRSKELNISQREKWMNPGKQVLGNRPVGWRGAFRDRPAGFGIEDFGDLQAKMGF